MKQSTKASIKATILDLVCSGFLWWRYNYILAVKFKLPYLAWWEIVILSIGFGALTPFYGYRLDAIIDRIYKEDK